MKALLNFWLALGAGLLGAGVPGRLYAQPGLTPPTLLWQHYTPQLEIQRYTPLYRLKNINRLSAGRYGITGQYLVDSATRRYSAAMLLLNEAGDSVGLRYYPGIQQGDIRHARLDPRTGLLVSSTYGQGPRPNGSITSGVEMFGVDTVGNVVFRKFHPPTDNDHTEVNGLFDDVEGRRPLLPVPTGYLSPFSQVTPPPYETDAGIMRIGRRGQQRQLWQNFYIYNGIPVPDDIYGLTFALDGSLVSAGGRFNVHGATNFIYYGNDYWVLRHHPNTLDTIETRHFGIDHHAEYAYDIQPTRDGGTILIGARQEHFDVTTGGVLLPGESVGEQAEIVKLDSNLVVQWRRRVNGGDNSTAFINRDDVCRIQRVQPTLDGGYVALGWRKTKRPVPRMNYHSGRDDYGFVLRLDSLGAVTWEKHWPLPYVDPRSDPDTLSARASVFRDWAYNSDGTAVILADYATQKPITISTGGLHYRWILKIGNLPLPWTPDYCRRPPAAPGLAVPVQQPQAGHFIFSSDSTTAAGPRYAELSLCTWDWGDGSPVDTGWVAQHRYLTPDPVRVRQCVMNNLFCQTCTDYYPLGYPNGVAEELAATISVYPNPSASGRFTVRTAGGGPEARAAFCVTDAVGRTVATGPLTGAETALDLHTQPAGVYALRLTWPDGRAVTKRLVRW